MVHGKRYRAAAELGEAHQGEQERALADAVSPQHREAAPLGHLEADVVEHHGFAVSGADVVE